MYCTRVYCREQYSVAPVMHLYSLKVSSVIPGSTQSYNQLNTLSNNQLYTQYIWNIIFIRPYDEKDDSKFVVLKMDMSKYFHWIGPTGPIQS